MKRRILSIALGALGVLAGAFLVTLHVAPYSVPDFESVRGDWRGSDAWLLDRNGETLSRTGVSASIAAWTGWACWGRCSRPPREAGAEAARLRCSSRRTSIPLWNPAAAAI